MATYLKAQQDKANTKLKKEKTKLQTKLDYKLSNSTNDQHMAMLRLKEIEAHEAEGKLIRYKTQEISSGAQLTKFHTLRAKKHFMASRMNAMQDMNGTLYEDQKGIESACVEYWSHIMSKREIDRLAMHHIFDNVTFRMPLNRRRKLGKNMGQHGYMSMEDFISIEEIRKSIKPMKLAKSPGPDGFPV